MININIKGTAQGAHQRFSCVLGSSIYEFRFDWHSRQQQWTVDLSIDDQPVVYGAAFQPGANIIHGYYGYGMLFCYGKEPTLDNLGDECFLLWVSEDEIRR